MGVSAPRARHAEEDAEGGSMKRAIRESYDNIKLDDSKKKQMLGGILKEYNAAVSRKQKRLRKIALAACAACAVAALAIIITPALMNRTNHIALNSATASSGAPTETVQAAPAAGKKDYATAIVLSMNPDVEIRLDAGGIVTEVVGLNEDGAALIAGIDFTGMSLENATIMVVNQLMLQGYLTAAEIQDEINISLSSSIMTLDTLSVMTNIIKTAASQQNISVDVIQDADANKLQIVLEGAGEPDACPELPPEEDKGGESPGVEMEFVMIDYTYSACVRDIFFHTRDGRTIQYLLDYAGDMRLNHAALLGIMELIEKGYISDAEGSTARFYFRGKCGDSDIIRAAELTKLLIAEYGLQVAVTADTEKDEIRLAADETVTHEAQISKYTLKDVLKVKINKDEEELSPRQTEILKSALTYREYQRLLEKRYYVVIPDLIGMTEEKAVDTMRQLGIELAVVRDKVPGYDPNLENGGLRKSDAELSLAEQDQERKPTWDNPVVDFGCVFYQDNPPGYPCPAAMGFQINVIVPMDDERPETTDYRKDSGFVLMDMDVPFDVSVYADTFSLSDAEGFDAMINEMNARYTITNRADYTVTIDRNTGWEDTAIITITHKDGFPMCKFFVQYGRIIELEALCRQDAPAEPDLIQAQQ